MDNIPLDRFLMVIQVEYTDSRVLGVFAFDEAMSVDAQVRSKHSI